MNVSHQNKFEWGGSVGLELSPHLFHRLFVMLLVVAAVALVEEDR